MKILLIHSYIFKTGGDWTYLSNIYDVYKNNGHTVSRFGIRDPQGEVKYFVDDCVFNSKVYHNSSNGSNLFVKIRDALNILFNFKVFFILCRHLLKFRPDIIQMNSIHSALSPSVLFALLIFARHSSIFWRVLDYKLVCPNRTLINADNLDCRLCIKQLFPVSCVRNRCKNQSLMQSIFSAVENTFVNLLIKMRGNVRFLLQSEFSYNIMKQAGYSENGMHVLYNPIQIKSMDLIPYIKSSQFDLIYFGRLSSEKGIIRLLKEVSGSKFTLVVIGDGPLSAEVAEFSDAHNNIFYVGALWGDDLADYIRKSKICVIPSMWNEVSPYVLLESYKYGTPVLASDKGGTKDLVIRGQTGEIYSPEVPGALINMVHHMIINYQHYEQEYIYENLRANHSFDTYLRTSMQIFGD